MKYFKYIITVIIGIIGFGLLFINQPKKSISGRKAAYTLSSHVLMNDFEASEEAANKKYLDKIIVVEGKINSISTNEKGLATIFLETGNPMSNISCQLSADESEKIESLKNGDRIKIKGMCTGILMDVVLVDCVIENEN